MHYEDAVVFPSSRCRVSAVQFDPWQWLKLMKRRRSSWRSILYSSHQEHTSTRLQY